MYFCEDCKIKKNWPESAVVIDEKCEQCGILKKCYDVPAVMLVPEKDRTFEQKMVLKMLQDGFRDKAESLVITMLDGRVDHILTSQLKKLIAVRGTEIDWYSTFQVRLRAQEGHRESERVKRDK
jgi:hypothetical protein